MIDYWEKLSLGQKATHIFWGVIGLFVLTFAFFNWGTITLNLVFGSAQVPVTVLIVISMLGGFGYAKVFGYVKSRKKDKEIKYLKGELAAVREKAKRPTPTSNSAPKDTPKKIEGLGGEA